MDRVNKKNPLVFPLTRKLEFGKLLALVIPSAELPGVDRGSIEEESC
jgi:hypothetical protein